MTVIVSNGAARSMSAKSYPGPLTYSRMAGPSSGAVDLLRGDHLAITYEAIYRSQPAVFAVINKLLYGVARNRIVVQAVAPDGTRTVSPGTSLQSLIDRPFPRGSQFALKDHIASDGLIHGNALLLKYRPSVGAAPTELWPVPWHSVQTVSDERGIYLYGIGLGTAQYAVGPEDVIHVRFPGGSPLEPLRRTVALEDAAATWQGENLRNGVTPRGAWVSETRLNDAVLPRLREELTKLYAGPENAGRAAILEGGLDWKQIGLSAADAQLLEGRRFSREEVCAAYDVHPAIVGFADMGTNQSSEYRRSLYDAIAGRIILIEDTINAQLVFDEPDWDGLQVRFDTTELTRADPETRAQMHMLNQQSSTSTINERRSSEGFPRIDDPLADTVFMPTNMIPVGVPMPAVAAPDAVAGTPAQGTADRLVASLLTTGKDA